MQYIIDGHNLIPYIRGISLADLDDEEALLAVLVSFARLSRSRLGVYFDQASPGQSGERRLGAVTAFFVPQAQTADTAIIAHLRKLGPRARNCSLVSSDRQVQAAGHAAHMNVLTSASFAAKIEETLSKTTLIESPSKPMSETELEEWERVFTKGISSDER